MTAYQWRGWTPRHEALRQLADSQWAHDQLIAGQRARRQREAQPTPPPDTREEPTP